MLWQPGSACYGYSHRAIGPRGARRSEDEMNEARPSDGGGCNLSRGGGSMGALASFFPRNCHENRMAGRCLMRPAHTEEIRADLVFIHNGAPLALVGSQAAQRRAPSTTHSPSKDGRLSTGYGWSPSPVSLARHGGGEASSAFLPCASARERGTTRRTVVGAPAVGRTRWSLRSPGISAVRP